MVYRYQPVRPIYKYAHPHLTSPEHSPVRMGNAAAVLTNPAPVGVVAVETSAPVLQDDQQHVKRSRTFRFYNCSYAISVVHVDTPLRPSDTRTKCDFECVIDPFGSKVVEIMLSNADMASGSLCIQSLYNSDDDQPPCITLIERMALSAGEMFIIQPLVVEAFHATAAVLTLSHNDIKHNIFDDNELRFVQERFFEMPPDDRRTLGSRLLVLEYREEVGDIWQTKVHIAICCKELFEIIRLCCSPGTPNSVTPREGLYV